MTNKMERWAGRVAIVTGASAGIGAAICETLVRNGMKVVGVARRVENIQALSIKLAGEKGSLLGMKCDVTKDAEVYDVFEKIKETHGGVDICINNAGVLIENTLLSGTPEEWRRVMDVNVIALCLFTKLSVASMKERGIDDGHIINISSITGHTVFPIAALHFYTGSKHAVRAISEGLRQELREAKSRIRVSELSPGLVKTEIFTQMFGSEEESDKLLAANAHMTPEQMAAIVEHIISAPPNVEINDVIVAPVAASCNWTRV